MRRTGVRRTVVLACGLAVMAAMCFASATPAAAATTEEVLAKLVKGDADFKSFEADMKMTSKGGDQSVTSTGHIATQAIVKDGKRAGALMNMKQQTTVGAMVMNTLMVNDGEFVWTETRNPQMGVMVMKMKPDAAKAPSGDTQQFRDMYDLKLVGEEEFDGQAMWILEGTPKKKADDAAAAPQAGAPEKMRIDIGQKDSFGHRYRTYDKAGAEMSDTQFTNIKLNGKPDPALFKYTPPAGANVMDMTKGMPNMGDMMKNMPKGAGDE